MRWHTALAQNRGEENEGGNVDNCKSVFDSIMPIAQTHTLVVQHHSDNFEHYKMIASRNVKTHCCHRDTHPM